MKIIPSKISFIFGFTCPIIAAWVGMVVPCHAQVSNAMTQEDLIKKRNAMTQSDPMKKMVMVETKEDPSKLLPRDIISKSDILSFGGISTLIPKNAIILIPKNYANRVAYVQGNPLVSWLDFYAKNRGWITTTEITFAQAKGEQAMPETVTKQISQSSNLVIATFSGGPISRLPLKTEMTAAK